MFDSGKSLDCQSGRWRLVEFGDLVQNLNSFALSALAKKELWRLIESEDKESEEEDSQSHETQDDTLVSPSHVARHRAARLSGTDSFTRWKLDVASVLSSCAVCSCRSNDDANRLPH